MGKISRFEDLICWQKALELVKTIYPITKTEPLSKDYGLKDQLRRAPVSSMTNIAEGYARYHRKEFIRFLDIAQSSAAEVKSLLYIVLDQNYVDEKTVSNIQHKTDEVQAVTLGLLKYIDKSINKQSITISEPEATYGSPQDPVHRTLCVDSSKSIKIPDRFINLEHVSKGRCANT